MKNSVKNFLSITFFSFLFLSSPVFGSQKTDSLSIEIDGKVLIPKKDDSKLYKIELLCHNTVVDSGVVVDSESFLMKIKRNSWYTIRITKEGYYPMLVSIDTKLPESVNELQKFHFDTELIPTSKTVDSESVEFPIAIISYNSGKDGFIPVKEYSRNIRTSIFDIQPKDVLVINK